MSEFVTKVVIRGEDGSGPALTSATKGIQNYAKAANAAQNSVRTSARQGRAQVQQLGYQIQDISVQLQAGQSPFVVLAQQGSQVASIFGPGGAVIGALLAVGGAIAGRLMPSLFETKEEIDDILSRAEKVGLDPRTATTITYAEDQKRIQDAINNTRQELVKYSEQISLLSGQYKAEIDQNGERTRTAFNLDQAIKENKRSLDDKLITLRELYAEQKKYNVEVNNSSVFEYKHALAMAETERRLKLRAELEGRAKTTLERHTDEVARITAAYQEGVIEKATWIKLLLQENEAYEKTLPKKKDDSKETARQAKAQADAFETLKRSLDPYYAAQQRYAEQIKLINELAVDDVEKKRLQAIANAHLQQAIGNVAKEQDKLKISTMKSINAYKPTPLEDYANAAKDLDSALEEAAMGGIKSIEDGFVNMINGSQSVADSFRSMAASIVNDLIRIQIQRSITGPLAGMMGNFFGNPTAPMMATTAPTATGSYIPMDFAGGGYTGSGVRSGGLDGKGGFMAMVHPNETVIDHEKGTGGAGVTINQTIQVTTGVQQTVRAEIMGMMPQIANASKAAVLDAKKRGGSYASAF